ncbi:MAG: AAA family ATPase [Caldilineaceae bacterium]|nr:AAA family ATPase [Caldilineaceae bacterium]
MPTLYVQLLGDFGLTYDDDRGVTVNQARQQALIAYLLLHRGTPQSRQRVAFLFWPDTSEAQAQTNLRQLLHHLRRAWPACADYIYVEPRTIAWQMGAPCNVDLVAFTQAAAEASAAVRQGRTDVARTACAQAVDLYRGELLPASYDEWLLAERERLRQTYLDILEHLVILCENERDYPAAIHYAQRFLRADPLHETTYRRLMRLYALNGDRASALRTYHLCATTLERELGVVPSRDTQEAHARLLNMATPPVLRDQPMQSSSSSVRLVGRGAEWVHLRGAWEKARQGHPHLVCIVGEAGIGKSRLAEELLDWVRRQGFVHARARVYDSARTLAYAPVTEWLRAGSFQPAILQLPVVWLGEVTRLLPELLVDRPDLPRPEPLTERWQLQRFYEALARAVMAAGQPLLFLLDDIQWCDLETLEWLGYLLHYDRTARLLVVATLRPEEVDDRHPLASFLLNLGTEELVTEIPLERLAAAETAMLAALVAESTFDPAAAERLFAETEGNPLFIIETVRSLASKPPGDAAVATRLESLPARLQVVIQRRLAQLTPVAREVADLAAVAGRSFTYELLARSGVLGEDTLVAALDELWRRRLVRVQNADDYDFSHGRIREVAYAQVSPTRRRLLHRRIAHALEQLHPDDLDTIAGELAAHCEQAGLRQQAAHYYTRAAESAHRLLAYPEMEAFLQKRLDLLDSLPATPENLAQQLDTLSRLGGALLIVKGLTAPEVEATLRRARTMCDLVEDADKRFEVLHALRFYWGQRCQWDEAARLNEELLALGYRSEEPVHLQAALRLTGALSFHQGRFQEAHHYFEQATSLFEVNQPRSRGQDFEQDQGIANLRRLAPVLWLLGSPDQARARMQELLERTRSIARPFDMLMSLDFAFDLAHYLRDPHLAQAHAAEYSALVAEHPYPHCVAVDLTFRGWVLAEQGAADAGIALIQRGIDQLRALDTLLYSSQGLALLVEAYARAGHFAQGIALVDEALAFVTQIGESYWNAEFYRTKGDMLLASGADTVEIERCYQAAIETARRQGAKSLELRAAVSLARLWQTHGQAAEARQLLAGIYNWFDEGFDTPDLQEAGALLDALRHSA